MSGESQLGNLDILKQKVHFLYLLHTFVNYDSGYLGKTHIDLAYAQMSKYLGAWTHLELLQF